jgi:trimethylamine--corrinoid protein Co-methyltransferase
VAFIIGKTVEGFDVNDETMAVDLIKDVGQVPGTFLNKNHTRENWKKEYFMPRVTDRLSYQGWINTGKKSIVVRARERMDDILRTHKPKPMPQDRDREIDRILADARNFYKEKGLL